MESSQIIEDIALVLILARLEEFASMRFSHADFSMESVVKKEAQSRGVDYKALLPMDLAERVQSAIQEALGPTFGVICEKFPIAIVWEAHHLIYGGDLELKKHPEAASYLAENGINYETPRVKFPVPEEEVRALKKALFDQ